MNDALRVSENHSEPAAAALDRETNAAWLSALVSSADDAIISKTTEGFITSWNKGAERLFGYRAGEVIGKPVTILIPAELQDEERLILKKIESGERIEHFETVRLRKDGSRVDISLTVSPIKTPDGTIIGASKIAREILRLDPAEAKSGESASPLRRITDALPALIAYIDEGLRYRFVNRRYKEWLRLDPEEVVGKTVLEVIGEAAYAKILPRVERAMAGEELTFEELISYPDGKDRYVRANYIPHFDPETGEPKGFFGLVQDMTESKKSEARLRESEERLRLFIEHAPAAVAMLDDEMRYLSTSRRWLEDFGFQSDLTGRSHYGAFPEISDEWKEIHRRCLAGVIERRDEDLFVREDGSRAWLQWEIRPWYTEAGKIGGVIIFSEDITERKEYAEKLRESEARFRNLSNSAPVLIWVNGIEGVEYVNQQYLDFLGVDGFEDVSGIDWARFVHPEDREDYVSEYQSAFARREKFFAQFRFRRRDGEYRWMSSVGTPRFSDSGQFLGYVGSTVDIHDLKLAEEALRENREILSLAMSSSRMGAWSRNLQTDEVYWSPELEAIFGLEAGTFAGTRSGFHEFVFEEDRQRIVGEVEAAIRKGESYIIEFRYRHADGSLHWMEGRGQAVYAADGKPVNVYGIGIDITERKRAGLNAEFLARLSQELVQVTTADEIVRTVGENLNGFLDISMCAFVEIAENAERAAINYEWHKSDLPSLVGEYHMPDFITDEFRAAALAGQTIVIRDVFNDERIAAPQKYIPLEIGAELHIPLNREGKWKYSLCAYHSRAYNWREDEIELLRELSSRIWARLERAFAEQERETLLKREHLARLQAEDANRLKDEFLATISHELRTPLNAILGWSQMLTVGNVDQDSAARAVETIYRNARAQAQLIEDILDVSRIITGKLRIDAKPVLLSPIIQTAIESLRPQIEAKNIRLQSRLGSAEREVNADPHRMQQIVWNLVSNAVKFTPAGGEVTLTLESTDADVKIVVADTGTGISPEFLPFVFERFRQADGSTTRNHGGLGLGLAIVRHIVELHGGTVEVKSGGEGKGTAFTVCLPLSKTPLDQITEQDASASGKTNRAASGDFADHSRIKGKRVLLVDDQKDSLELLATILGQKGIEVSAHSSVREALETVKSWKPDVIISDLAMPEEDGYSFIRKLRELPGEQGGAVPAIALTAYVGIKERTKVLSSGFQMYVPKPVEPAELLAALASLVSESAS